MFRPRTQSEKLHVSKPKIPFYRYIDKKSRFSTENPPIKQKKPIKSRNKGIYTEVISNIEKAESYSTSDIFLFTSDNNSPGM
ncbi:MAG: hypothetical protein A2168_01945 [Planctomycetes bacterium RBG_13_50_24]|nr:MAG: hypothetical protein A2168_01945 [Planctomycetes bacterium RBG_13_50_24]